MSSLHPELVKLSALERLNKINEISTWAHKHGGFTKGKLGRVCLPVAIDAYFEKDAKAKKADERKAKKAAFKADQKAAAEEYAKSMNNLVAPA